MEHDFYPNEVFPFYFGASPKKLYGCYHRARTSTRKSSAVVLCHPIGQEYIRSHREIYQLAVLLSRAGFDVLRFDYYGCGDSEGDFEDGSLAQWTEDIQAAVAEIKERSGLDSVCLIGLKIGATLAWQVASDCLYVKNLVLWEPVFSGVSYMKELMRSQAFFLKHVLKRSRWEIGRSKFTGEIIGFPFTEKLKQELEDIELNGLQVDNRGRLLILCDRKNSECIRDAQKLTKSNPHVDLHTVAFKVVGEEGVYKRLIPFNALLHIVKWIDGVHR